MSFSAADIARIARLARIELSADETAAAARELDGVFGIIEALRAVDTTGVALRLRDDVVTETDRRDAYQAPAPSVEGGLYLVPKVIE